MLPPNTGPAEPTEIKHIRQQYAAIRQAQPTLRRRQIELFDWSSEGGKATGYFQHQQLRLVEAAIYGELGQTHSAYYFDQGKLIFVLEEHQQYAAHVHTRPSLASATRSTERYYFHQGRLIRWLDARGRAITSGTAPYAEKQQELLAEAQELQTRLVR